MAERLIREYGVATSFIFDLWSYSDLRVRATLTPAAGDAKISKDGGAEANVGTLFTAEHGQWKQTLSAAEMQAAQIKLSYEDQDGPAWADRTIYIETVGGVSSQHGGLNAAQAEAFSIAAGTMVKFTVTTGASTTSIPVSALVPASAITDQFVPRAILFAGDTTTASLRACARKVLSFNHSTQTFTVDALPATPASGDYGVVA